MQSNNRAVFLDRDGIINRLIFNPETDAHESPHLPEDFIICEDAAAALKLLQNSGYMLFVVSNQPSWAKGKTTHENLVKIDDLLVEWADENGIVLTDRYYCFHHMDSILPELKQNCSCRKPGTLFLEQADREHHIDFESSWFIGDRATDIECGRRMGCRTALVKTEENTDPETANADLNVESVLEAAKRIVSEK